MRKASKTILICAMMVWAQAFSCASAIQELQTWAPTVLTAFSGIVGIVNPAAGSGLLLVDGALTKLFAPGGPIFSAISAYQANPGTGTLQNLTNALNDANAQFSAALADIPATLPPNDVRAVQAALLLLATTLEAFQARLAPTAPAAQSTHMARAVNLGVAPAKNRADFVKKYNVIMAQNGHANVKLS